VGSVVRDKATGRFVRMPRLPEPLNLGCTKPKAKDKGKEPCKRAAVFVPE
jgi:hypothetical protein